MNSKHSIQLFHTLLIIEYASNMQYIELVVCSLFLTVKFSCLFSAVAVLACLSSQILFEADICMDKKYCTCQMKIFLGKNLVISLY